MAREGKAVKQTVTYGQRTEIDSLVFTVRRPPDIGQRHA